MQKTANRFQLFGIHTYMCTRNKLVVYREITRVELVFRSEFLRPLRGPVEPREQAERHAHVPFIAIARRDRYAKFPCHNGGPAATINLRITSSGLKHREPYINRPGPSKFLRFTYLSRLYIKRGYKPCPPNLKKRY